MRTVRAPRCMFRLLLLFLLAILLWLSPSLSLSPAAAAGPYLYVTSTGNSRLIVSNLDGSSPVNKGNLGGNLSGPSGMALDVKNQQMYIANYNGGAGTVVRTSLSGASPTPLNFGLVTLTSPRGVALDLANRKIYVADSGAKKIVKADLDGSSATLFDFGVGVLDQPWAIALDTANNHMYVTSFGNGRVVRADLDGNNSTVIDFGSLTINSPMGIALDLGAGKMYVTNFTSSAGEKRLVQANLDGSGALDLGNLGNLDGAAGIAIDSQSQHLYIVGAGGSGKLMRTDLNGGSLTDLTALAGWGGLLNLPYFVALDSPPDLTISKGHTHPGTIPAGSGFEWKLLVRNVGPNPAVFGPDEAMLRDYIPAGPTYSVGAIQSYGVTSSVAVSCNLSASALYCTPGLGRTSLASGSWMVVTLRALTHAAGTLTNPSGGVCRADPDHVTGETNTTDNDCSDSVTVYAPNAAKGQRMYVVNSASDAVSRANLDGSSGLSLGNPGALLDSPQAIALDLVHEKMYVSTGPLPGRVIRANLDGTGGTDLLNLAGFLNYPSGIALDVAGNRMYVSNFLGQNVVSADLNGNGGGVLVNLPVAVNSPTALALDLVRGYIFVTARFTNNVYRLKLNGTEGTDLGNLGGRLNFPRGIAVDSAHGTIYVTSSGNDKIVRAKWDGTDIQDYGNLGGLCSGPAAAAFSENTGQAYFTCMSPGHRVVRANLDGSSPQNLGNLDNTLAIPGGIALDTRGLVDLPLLQR